MLNFHIGNTRYDADHADCRKGYIPNAYSTILDPPLEEAAPPRESGEAAENFFAVTDSLFNESCLQHRLRSIERWEIVSARRIEAYGSNSANDEGVKIRSYVYRV